MEYMNKIVQIRKEKHITQQKIADHLMITQQQYSDYERGKNELPIRYLILICKYLKVSSDWILGLDTKE